jgi:hypothetical protein
MITPEISNTLKAIAWWRRRIMQPEPFDEQTSGALLSVMDSLERAVLLLEDYAALLKKYEDRDREQV